MNIFQKIDTGFGFPLYYQRMPEMVKSVSLQWLVFTGAADDESVGLPGLHHWFEHVPFRGTKNYSSGYQSLQAPFLDFAGSINAYTNMDVTNYNAFVPIPVWQEALRVITDLFSQPLITDAGVEAEREIIEQEIVKARSNFARCCSRGLWDLVFQAHPRGHDVLGTEESLRAMNPNHLREAHAKGYDLSRSALFVAGNISHQEVLAELQALLDILPRRGLSPRTKPANYSNVSWFSSEHTSIETEFKASMSMVVFPLKGSLFENQRDVWFLRNIFGYGNMASPIFRVVRAEKNLVYSANPFGEINPDCSYFGFAAESKKQNIPRVIEAFRKLLSDEELATEARISNIVSGVQYALDMDPVDPHKYVETAIGTMVHGGRLINEDERRAQVAARTAEEAERVLALLDPNLARTVVFEGTV